MGVIEHQHTTDPEFRSESKGGPGSYWALWALLLLLFIYALSIGPAAKLHKVSPPARPAIEAVYYPIVALSKDNETVANALNWHVEKIWGVR